MIFSDGVSICVGVSFSVGISFCVGVSFSVGVSGCFGFTPIVTVADFVYSSPSTVRTTLYTNVSFPVKPLSGIYSNVPSSLNFIVPFFTFSSNTVFNESFFCGLLTISLLSLARTVPASRTSS